MAKSHAVYQETQNNVVGLNTGKCEKHDFHMRENLCGNWSEMDGKKSLTEK